VNGGWIYVTIGVDGIEPVDASASVTQDSGSQSDDEASSTLFSQESDGGGGGVLPGPAQIVAIDAETGELRWSHDLAIRRAIRTPPAVADGVVVVGTDLGTVVGLEAMSGLERWGFQAAGPINGSPAIASGEVVVADYDGAVHALDLQTGAEQWSINLGASVSTSAAIVNGVIYVGHDGGGLVALGAGPEAPQG
jgi:outer membrane protein assembly factor BamB